jgi:hypothetical protein
MNGSLLRVNGNCSGLCASQGACDGIVISSTIKMNEYIATHTYPGPGIYKLCFDMANRNSAVVNIPNSVDQTMAFESYLIIPTFGSGKNTSSVFANHPIADGCLTNSCFTYNPLATDIDGDSLSYEIDQCRGHSGVTPGYWYPNAGTGGLLA